MESMSQVGVQSRNGSLGFLSFLGYAGSQGHVPDVTNHQMVVSGGSVRDVNGGAGNGHRRAACTPRRCWCGREAARVTRARQRSEVRSRTRVAGEFWAGFDRGPSRYWIG